MFKVLAILAISFAVAAARLRYDGHEVLRSYPANREQVAKLDALREKYDFWTEPRLNGPTDIRSTPTTKLFLRNYLDLNGIKYETLANDVERLIYWEDKSQVRSAPDAIDFTSYHSVAEIQAFVRDISSRNSDISEVIKIGESYQGRDLLVIRIGNNPDGRTKKAFWIDGGIHAREWIAPAIATYTINELLTNRNRYTDLLNEVDIYILTNANPDGYEYTRSTDRLWRKTRQPHGSLTCVGADPNRNFDVAFGGLGTSTNKCSEIYTGPAPFSEPETAAMRNFINNRASADWRVYVALHSYAQMILTPWGYTYDLPSDYSDLRRLGDQAAAALTAVHGTPYQVGSVTEILSPGAGGSDDWAKGSGNFKYSYTIEVRDTGRYGFLLPASQIIPTSEETFEALLVMANHIKNSA